MLRLVCWPANMGYDVRLGGMRLVKSGMGMSRDPCFANLSGSSFPII